MTELFLILGMTLVTFSIRYLVFAVAGWWEFPPPLARALRYVPPAVLTAIVVPAVLMPTGDRLELSYTNAYLAGALVACAIGWFSRNLLLTILLGMLAFLGYQWLLAAWLA